MLLSNTTTHTCSKMLRVARLSNAKLTFLFNKRNNNNAMRTMMIKMMIKMMMKMMMKMMKMMMMMIFDVDVVVIFWPSMNRFLLKAGVA